MNQLQPSSATNRRLRERKNHGPIDVAVGPASGIVASAGGLGGLLPFTAGLNWRPDMQTCHDADSDTGRWI